MAAKTINRTSKRFVESDNFEFDTVSIVSTLTDCELNSASDKKLKTTELLGGTTQPLKTDSSSGYIASSSDDDNCLADKLYEDLQASETDSDSDDDKDIDVEEDDIGAVFEETREIYKHELSQTLPCDTKAVSKDVSIQDIEAAIDEIPQTDNNNEDQSKEQNINRTSKTFAESGNFEFDTVSIVSTLTDCELNSASDKNPKTTEFLGGTTQAVKTGSSSCYIASSPDDDNCVVDKFYADFQASDNDSDSGEDIGAVFEETREIYKHELSQTLPDYTKAVSKDVSMQDIEAAIDEIPQPDNNNEDQSKDKSCANCCTKKRVDNACSFKIGQHIRILGRNFTFNFGKNLKTVYNHHAIVKQINKADDQKAELVLIHFDNVDEVTDIHETSETFDLARDEIYIVEYLYPRYEPDDIVKRAESMLPENWQNSDKCRNRKFGSYNVLTRNSEHFAAWCVVGAEESFQVKGLRETIAQILTKGAGIGCKIASFIKRFLYSSADKITHLTKLIRNCLPGISLGLTDIAYLIYCIVITIKLFSKYKRCELCKTCFKREVTALWTHFGAFLATSGISYILVHFLMPLIAPIPVGIPLLLVIVLLSLAMQWGIGKVRSALMSPYECEKVPVLKLSDLNEGSMITFNYFGFQHFAIVTGVHGETGDSSTIGSIRCVHYGLKSLNIFRKRHVMEELIRVDLNKASKKLMMVDCKHLNSYPSHQVVQRVKQRVGETNWSAVSNRSDHLCFWAFVKQENELEKSNTNAENTENIGETKSKHKSSLCTGQTEVHVREEVRLGDVVKYGGTNGIVVNLDDISQCEAQEFEMELMVYKNYYAIREKKMVNLKKKRLFVKNYHPSHCCSMGDRVQRACEKENTKCKYWLNETFFESCILKN